MDGLKTVQVVQVRACDLPEGGYVRPFERDRNGGRGWRYVYEVTRGGESSAYDRAEVDAICQNDIDERWVVLWLGTEPTLELVAGRRGEERRKFAVTAGSGRAADLGTRNGTLTICKAEDLWDLQTVVEVEHWAAD